MKSDSTPTFDGAYLERYRRRELSPSEAHALEKAALEDPLLADALDGFHLATHDTSGDLNLLRVRLNERIESSQAAIRQMPKTRYFSPFLRVAAILLILLGAGWFSYVYWIEPGGSSLAVNDPVNKPAKDPRITSESAPVQSALQSAQPVSPESTLQNTPIRQSPSPILSSENEKVEPREQAKPDEALLVQAEQPKVLTEIKNAEPTIAEDVVKDQVVVSADRSQKQADLATNRQVLASTQVAKEKSLNRSQSDKQLTENPEPADGWDAYNEYLNSSRSSKAVAPTASNTVTQSQVLLSFEVDKNGRPTKVRVEESGGMFYNDAAKKLLRDGPDWKPGKTGARGKLRVHF